MDRTVARIGSWAGLLAIAGILAYHLGLMVVAGQRVSGVTDAATIRAYYEHEAIAVLGVEQAFVLVLVLVFLVALREAAGRTGVAGMAALVGLAAGIAEMPAILVMLALQAAIVAGVSAGSDIVPIFRFWDVLYNSGTYALEATWVVAFGLALRDRPSFPRWFFGLSLITGVLLAVNVTAIWVGIPDVATLPSAGLLAAWFVGAAIGLRREARGPAAALSGAVAPSRP